MCSRGWSRGGSLQSGGEPPPRPRTPITSALRRAYALPLARVGFLSYPAPRAQACASSPTGPPPRRPPLPPPRHSYCRNLPASYTRQDVGEMFVPFGTVLEIRL